MGIMTGKVGVVMGIANKMSIAWGIADALHKQGAKMLFTYQGEIIEKRIAPLADEVGAEIIECDVSTDAAIADAFARIEAKVGKIDFVVHAIAFSDKEELRGRYVDTSRANFALTMDISCYSFTSVCKYASEIMNDGGSFITLSYYGAEKYIPHYNVMGVAKAALEASIRYLACDLGTRQIRVNAISAGPIKTLAASGIGDFKLIFKWTEENTPLHSNTSIEQVGGSAVYLLSDLSSGVTGEVVHVDSGYHVMGMKMYDGTTD